MYLYLIRHGIAENLDPLVPNSIASDEIRTLTKIGRKKITQVAAKLQKLELSFDLLSSTIFIVSAIVFLPNIPFSAGSLFIISITV